MRKMKWCCVSAVLLAGFGMAFADELVTRPVSPGDVGYWAARAFAGKALPGNLARVALEVVRQDHSVLQFGRSCIDTPLAIGDERFTHGLGAHANSEIVVTLPPDAKTFAAQVGVDNNNNTGGARGSVIFIVEIDGKESARTPVLRGGAAPVPIRVDIPAGAAKMMLKVDATEDGVSCDQADWAEAQLIMADSGIRWLDDYQNPLLFLDTLPPFSFVYNGVASSTFISGWDRTVTEKETASGAQYSVSWTDPATQLAISAKATTYKDFSAVDWVLALENKGGQDTPIIENVQALDALLRTGYLNTPTLIHELEGDACGEASFRPKTKLLDIGEQYSMAPTGGRSSSISAFPFFNVQYVDQGLIAAVGWTGQWATRFDRLPTGPTRMQVGMERTHLVLHPGESIRTPRIVLLAWSGDRTAAHNQFRQLLLKQYVPQQDGKPVPMPIALQTYDRYNSRPEWACEAGQLKAVDMAKKLGCDSYWLDAAWFPGNFPNGVGNWFCKPAEFPNGLKPVSDACHLNGMRFILWFEPERVAPSSQIAKEHPEFVFGGEKGGLFKLNDPEARRWLTELLSRRITEYGIDVYRNDFNMDPLDSWRNNDAPDRQGMTEIRYVEGLYAMWDELLARHPGLLIDNCSSGGRRMDIEMCSRSVPLWRSDTNCAVNHPEWNQAQSLALCQYVPLHTAAPWFPDPYIVRSASTTGLLCQFDYLGKEFNLGEAQRLIAESRENQPYWLGDFYPLTPSTTDLDTLSAWQFHREDLDAGLVVAFRRPECNYHGLIVGLHGVKPEGNYTVQFVDDAGKKTEQIRTGADLGENLELRLPKAKSSLLVRYKRVSSDQ